jgi:hypothetical protein
VSTVEKLLSNTLPLLQQTLCFEPMHAAVLEPGRLATWLEGAAKLEEPKGQLVFEAVVALLAEELPQGSRPPEAPEAVVAPLPDAPTAGDRPPEAPAMVSAQQWREGAWQLQQEVMSP